MALREEVPREFTDDVRWYKYFTQKMIAAIVIVAFFGFLLCKLLSLIHLETLGIALTVILLITVMILLCVPMPRGNLMGGSGLNLGTVLIRMFIMKKKRNVLYIKGYEEGEKDDAATN